MLAHLSIRNFALIERADIDFNQGFSVITGETGSGKSILLGALNLILGERADYSVIRNTEVKTIVEATFRLSSDFKQWFLQNDLDWEQDTLIRREITAQGKSRAFINDSPVQLSQLKELTEQLIYIHSQHQTLAIKKSDFQFDLLDSFGDLLELAATYKTLYSDYKQVQRRLKQLQETTVNDQKEIEFIRFQLDELEQLKLADQSFETVEMELNRLSQLDDLRYAFSAISSGISDESGASERVRSLKSTVDKWKHVDPQLEQLTERLQSCLIELEDISEEASRQLDALEVQPEHIALLTSMVDRYNHVLRKHHLASQEDLMNLERVFADRVTAFEHSDELLEQLEKELHEQEGKVKELAGKLYELRSRAAEKISEHLQALMTDLKLADARIRFSLQQLPVVDVNGGMTISCLFSANAGMDLKPIEKAASGGELSRLMLAIQATLSKKKALPTLILDEIDTGVSGEVALRIGKMLQEMGRSMQLFAITHLPQVAAKGTHHFEVSKTTSANETNTKIELLSNEQRVMAIAKLLSGDHVTEASKANATALMASDLR